MKALAMLIGLSLTLASCADTSPNLKAYYDMAIHHDTQQALQVQTTVSAIRSAKPLQFETKAEEVLFAALQAILIADIKYRPLGIAAPLTGYDLLSRVAVPVLQLVNPWLLWAVADTGSGSSKSNNPAYVVNGGGDLLVNSANTGSQNTESVVGVQSSVTRFRSDDYCLDCEDDEDENDFVTNPVVFPPGYVCEEGEMYNETCSCESFMAGTCS